MDEITSGENTMTPHRKAEIKRNAEAFLTGNVAIYHTKYIGMMLQECLNEIDKLELGSQAGSTLESGDGKDERKRLG